LGKANLFIGEHFGDRKKITTVAASQVKGGTPFYSKIQTKEQDKEYLREKKVVEKEKSYSLHDEDYARNTIRAALEAKLRTTERVLRRKERKKLPQEQHKFESYIFRNDHNRDHRGSASKRTRMKT